jgi:hypothetical protein
MTAFWYIGVFCVWRVLLLPTHADANANVCLTGLLAVVWWLCNGQVIEQGERSSLWSAGKCSWALLSKVEVMFKREHYKHSGAKQLDKDNGSAFDEVSTHCLITLKLYR